jgi:hypothetical protein
MTDELQMLRARVDQLHKERKVIIDAVIDMRRLQRRFFALKGPSAQKNVVRDQAMAAERLVDSIIVAIKAPELEL